MPWAKSRPRGKGVDAKYRTPEHRAQVAAYNRQLARDGQAFCAQPVCILRSRLILPGMAWCAGHDDTGTRYIGLVHAACNRRDGSVRARARQTATRLRW
jgi:hypothetical protein